MELNLIYHDMYAYPLKLQTVQLDKFIILLLINANAPLKPLISMVNHVIHVHTQASGMKKLLHANSVKVDNFIM